MAIDFWSGLNVGVNFDIDEETGSSLMVTLDHDELKGIHQIEFYEILESSLDDDFDSTMTPQEIEDTVLPEFEDIREYLLKCIKLVDQKIILAKEAITDES